MTSEENNQSFFESFLEKRLENAKNRREKESDPLFWHKLIFCSQLLTICLISGGVNLAKGLVIAAGLI